VIARRKWVEPFLFSKFQNIFYTCFVRGLNPCLLRRFSMREYLNFEAQVFMPGRMSLNNEFKEEGKWRIGEKLSYGPSAD